MLMKLKIFLIDSTSPFFIKTGNETINWSKIPFSLLEKNGRLRKKYQKRIDKNFISYIQKVSKLGFNAISIDDLSHLIQYDFYTIGIKKKIAFYQSYLGRLFKICAKYNMDVYITTDIMFYNKFIWNKVKRNKQKISCLLNSGLEETFKRFPEIKGIIFRIGESDGVDIRSDFKSRLIIKKATHANHYLKELLPVFEKYDKYLIFRTWTTGAYKIGDLMWNKKTYDKVFADIISPNLIISMKYGEADFFHYLGINELIFYKNHKKIIEFQTRREYEGFGEYPSFVGWYYQKIYKKVKDNSNIMGISVWCQTGGWSTFRNLTFLKKTSIWNEINTYVTIKLFKDNLSVKKSVAQLFPDKDIKKVLKFLKLSEKVILNLLYDPEFAKNRLYFNKVRIPPILHIFWDNISVTNAIIALYNSFSKNKNLSIINGFEALNYIKKMKELNESLNFPYHYEFHYESFRIIALIRKLIYYKLDRAETLKLIKKIVFNYHVKYPLGYKFYINVRKVKNSYFLSRFIRFVIRRKKPYRIIDRLLFNPFTSQILLLSYKILRKNFPEFIGNQAMPFSTFLK